MVRLHDKVRGIDCEGYSTNVDSLSCFEEMGVEEDDFQGVNSTGILPVSNIMVEC